MSYNLIKARYPKRDESGKEKVVTETYLVDCLSKTEGEARIIEELSPLYSKLQVKSIGDTNIDSIFNSDDADRFYLAKVGIITIDEKTAKESREVCQWLIGGTDFNDAYEMLLREISKCMCDIEIIGLSESPIKEYFKAKS